MAGTTTAKAIVIVGMTGTGKSTYVKNNILLKVPFNNQLIFDVNNEYKNFNTFKEIDIFKFMQTAKVVNNKLVLFEEATIFFSNKGVSMDLFNILVRKRHQNNTLVFVFHSLRRVPLDILDMVDYLVLFKTNDNPSIINSKFKDTEKITSAFLIVNKSVDKYKPIVVKL